MYIIIYIYIIVYHYIYLYIIIQFYSILDIIVIALYFYCARSYNSVGMRYLINQINNTILFFALFYWIHIIKCRYLYILRWCKELHSK